MPKRCPKCQGLVVFDHPEWIMGQGVQPSQLRCLNCGIIVFSRNVLNLQRIARQRYADRQRYRKRAKIGGV